MLPALDPRLLSVATAVPPHRLDQAAVQILARTLFAERPPEDLERLLPVFANAGIENRYSCVPLEWYERPQGWAEKNRLYLHHAAELSERASRLVVIGEAGLDRAAIEEAGLGMNEIDAVVAVSTSGIATPSLDALLVERMGLRRDVRRLPVFGLGCAGGVLGLTRAAQMARAMPGARVLCVVVELCGLTFRRRDQSNGNMVAVALFGDGAAAAVLGPGEEGPTFGAGGEYTWPQSLDVMGWTVEDDGFGVLFSRDIPALIRKHFRPALDRFLDANGIEFGEIHNIVCHPGGAKVVAALESALGFPPGRLILPRQILREFGNMSAASVMFVLDRSLKAGDMGRGLSLMAAVGPGFTAGFQILDSA